MYNPYDFYFKQAKKQWYKARSAFKLEEIDKKYKIFDKNIKNILDIGCAPGSWIQYAWKRLNDIKNKEFKIIWFDLKKVDLNLKNVYTYSQDITKLDEVEKILKNHAITKFDVILSDMAPNTIWLKDIDAIRSINLLFKTIPIYEKYLSDKGKIVIKIFMWPKFDDFVSYMKKIVGWKNIKLFKPKATRKNSKEIYFVKY